MAPRLELCMTMKAYIAVGSDILQVPNVWNGPTRMFIPVKSGFVKGTGPAAGLEAEANPASSDGVLLNTKTNTAHLNVRVGARTSSGEAMYIQYNGILKLDDAGEKVFQGATDAKSTGYGQQEWFMTPTFETSSEKFKWLEETVWVGQGRYVVDDQGSAVEYRIYRVVNEMEGVVAADVQTVRKEGTEKAAEEL